MKLSQSVTKAINETKYLSVDNHARYRLIMRFFYINYMRINYWLNVSQVYDGVREHIPGYTTEDCKLDLESLTEWGNLLNDHDTERIFTIKDFKNKRFRYQLSEYSVEIERLTVKLENMNVDGASLDIGLLGEIRAQIEGMRSAARAQIWMGLPGFEEPLDYVMLCLVLLFLENKGKGEQFILSQLTESIDINSKDIHKIDWTLFRHRKSLVRALRFAVDAGMIKSYDGDTGRFADDAENEVLYESSGLSRYFARLFARPVTADMTIEDIENETELDIDHDRGDYRRHRVYRKLLFTPAVYRSDTADFDYIKNFRGFIARDIERMTEGRFELHRTAALMTLPQSSRCKALFPSSKAISDMVLQLNFALRHRDDIPESETLSMPYSEFYGIALTLIRGHSAGWSKEYREKSPDEILSEIIGYMRRFSMLEREAARPLRHKLAQNRELPAPGRRHARGKHGLSLYGVREARGIGLHLNRHRAPRETRQTVGVPGLFDNGREEDRKGFFSV